MRRRAALVPLSHDHHHALVEARRLRRAVDGSQPAAAAAEFLRFFGAEIVRHFREEEESLFPLVSGFDEARDPVARALLEHQRLHALAGDLGASLRSGDGAPLALMRELSEVQEAHVRYEERELFPLLERLLGDSDLAELRLGEHDRGSVAGEPVWGAESEDLNATLLEWSPGGGPPEHVNEERDVLVAILEGSAVVALDGEERWLDSGDAFIVGKGRRRRITAGPGGVRYLSVHRRRPALQISRRSSIPADEA